MDAAGARDAFIRLAKRYHPDGGTDTADENKFKQVEKSYRRLLQKFSDERRHANEAEGEYGLYYEQKKKQQNEPEDDDTEEQSRGFYNLKVEHIHKWK